ncbi:MAG: ECF transporter S component [Clostridia bacterium]|nr:ECF transporter S component [Clostridia bacterium]
MSTAGSSANKKKVRYLVFFAIMVAIEAIFCFTPLGSIPIIPGMVVATLAMIPVCITGVLLGVKGGTAMGFIAGLFSFIVWTFMPPNFWAIAFTPFYKLDLGGVTLGGSPWSLVICFVPRILVGTVSALIYKAIAGKTDKNGVRITGAAVAGLCGSVVNTVGVLGGIALFMHREFSLVYAMSAYGATTLAAVLGTTILSNSIPEAIVSAIVTPSAVPIQKLIKGKL